MTVNAASCKAVCCQLRFCVEAGCMGVHNGDIVELG